MVHLQKLNERFKNRGFAILSISTESPTSLGDVRSFVRQRGFTFPVLFDGETAVSGRINPRGMTPFTLILDKNLTVVWQKPNFNPGDVELMAEVIQSLLE